MIKLAITLSASFGTFISASSPSFAAQLTFSETIFNTDWTSAGYGGMRGIGTGSIDLSGVTGKVNKALLYWHGPTNSNDPNANSNVSFNATNIAGANIGFSDDNFWGFDNGQAYRSDITSLVTGNGIYSLANFIKPGVEINGASLLVFFDDGNTSNNRDVLLFHGNDANFSNPFNPDGWDVTLAGINYDGGDAFINLGVSDGQTFPDDALVVNGAIIAPSGAVFQGNSVPRGPGGPSNGGLWDIKNYDVTGLLTPGSNTLNLTTGATNDALSAVYVAVDLEAGAAPDQPDPNPIPTPALLPGLIGMGVAALRKRGQEDNSAEA
ncbi:MAG: PTPA-CTERM sorting domain-containing protein [Leptolyngbyaceae cyanobacterium SM2_5_2]|nr:PTPA-CTERM sorting domain-containing protein [Leptolyngbyaceae cyanobacterium SM2_5_2]